MTPADREAILEEEVIILRNSGEIPEIALHSSLFYLEEDEEGPGISLHEEELHRLYDAAIARAKEIVLRDLDPGNRGLGIYRGPARSIVNWHRLQNFCKRINRRCHGFRQTVSKAFLIFLQVECEEMLSRKHLSSVNCSSDQIRSFCLELGIDINTLPDEWTCLCSDG